jgi:hypothetical protein
MKREDCKFVFQIYFFIACFVSFTVSPIVSGGLQKIRIDWKSVKGNLGYKIQILDATSQSIREEIISEESISLEIPPGNYSIRVSALNKFKKPSNWSDWKKITIQDSLGVQKISMNPDAQSEEPTVVVPETQTWKKWVPGLYTNSTNSPKMYLYAGVFSSMFYYVYWNKKQGDFLAEKLSNQESFLTVSAWISPNQLAPYSYWQRNQDREEYDGFQSRQRMGGYAILGLYTLSLVDSFYLSSEKPYKLSFHWFDRNQKNQLDRNVFMSIEFSF